MRTLALTWVLIASTLAPTLAFGHRFAPALLSLRERAPNDFDVRWTLPDGAERLRDSARWPATCQYTPASETAGRLTCAPEGLRGAPLTFSAPLELELIVHVAFSDGTIRSGMVARGDASFALAARPPRAQGGLRYAWLGVTHILSGVDHLLFLLGLTLLIRRRRALFIALTAFTVGHSVTLALATLGMVAIPVAPTEALIAASLVVLAVEHTRAPNAPSLLRRQPALLAGGFGLLHGLGFAGALASVGLPAGAIPTALFAFNIGVELGQLAFVSALLGLRALLARPSLPARSPLRLVPVYAVGALGVCLFADCVLALLGGGR